MPKRKSFKLSRTLLEAIDPANSQFTRSQLGRSVPINLPQKSVRVDGTLPILAEHLRDFAFRYALENRSIAEWGRIYHVAAPTVGMWLQRADVLKYVMTIRYERRLRLLEMADQIEGKAMKKLNEMLDQEITPANTSSMLTAIFKTLSMVREGRVPDEAPEANFNVTLNHYADNRQINLKQEEIQAELEELEAVEKVLSKKHEKVALPILTKDGEE